MASTIARSVLATNHAAAKLPTTSGISDNATFERMPRHTAKNIVPNVISAATAIIFACASVGTSSDAREYRLTGIGMRICKANHVATTPPAASQVLTR